MRQKAKLAIVVIFLVSFSFSVGCNNKPLINAAAEVRASSVDSYSWSQQKVFENFVAGPGQIECLDDQHVWLACLDRSDYSRGAILFFDGNSWQRQFIARMSIGKICAASDNAVWALASDELTAEDIILYFNGLTWSEQYRTSSVLDDICCADNAHAWAAGNEILSYDGKSWSRQSTSATGFVGITAADPHRVWACTKDACWFFDGDSWREQLRPGSLIKDISSVKSGEAWMLCCTQEEPTANKNAQYQFLFFKNGRWRVQQEITGNLDHLEATDRNHAWAWNYIESHGEVNCYYYDGINWARFKPGDLYNVNCISASGPDTTWFTGGYG
ncbi:MAG: hypothetical protein A2Y75_00345 [Candidatus Solincola sediminis]|uniref:Photosynthesis system II assembly factor Ycf48/Hcf136-like domain-containing protein n=1 Tax=Candidatus Solincola sediminis TaxID=1797199 RepID=A0A1F2WQ13_9ACTN|nr:MAG: hypothetical protein A2Y75_00345 [Candidatus Solincola sediminis]